MRRVSIPARRTARPTALADRVSGRRVLAGVLACALAGCASGLHSNTPADQVYVLRMPSAAAAGATSADGISALERGSAQSLRLTRPVAGPGLASDHIALVESDHRMSFYSGGRWPAQLPEVVEALALQALRNSGEWSSVQTAASAFAADYLLQIVIRRFEAEYDGAASTPTVHVVLDCTLGERASRDIVASFSVDGTAEASANRLGDVVAAFESASQHALEALAARARPTQKVPRPVPSSSR